MKVPFWFKDGCNQELPSSVMEVPYLDDFGGVGHLILNIIYDVISILVLLVRVVM